MAAKKKKAEEEDLPKVKRKPEDKVPSHRDRIDALEADVKKEFRGRAVMMNASDYVLPYYYKRLPTGLPTLDVELKGGWPAGGLSQLIGRKNAGKTALMWMTVRQLQAFLGEKTRVLLAMTEIPADRKQGRLLGAQISLGDTDIEMMNDARKAAGWPPFTKEEVANFKHEVGTIKEIHAESAEDFYDIILRAVEGNMFHLVVIDSIGNALAAAEQENESIKDKTYGGTSAPNTTFLKKLTNLLTMRTEWGELRDTCVLGINQVRDNIKDPNKKYKAPGGNSLEHAKLVDLYVESGGFIGGEESIMTPEGRKNRWRAHGKEVFWTIEKGKAGLHEGAKGSYVYDFDTNSVNYFADAFVAGVMNGVVIAEGAWIGIPDPNDPEKFLMRIQGRENFIAALAADFQAKANTDEMSYFEFIQDQCFRRNNIVPNNWDAWK
jgi:RecA/RadA recombinase